MWSVGWAFETLHVHSFVSNHRVPSVMHFLLVFFLCCQIMVLKSSKSGCHINNRIMCTPHQPYMHYCLCLLVFFGGGGRGWFDSRLVSRNWSACKRSLAMPCCLFSGNVVYRARSEMVWSVWIHTIIFWTGSNRKLIERLQNVNMYEYWQHRLLYGRMIANVDRKWTS